MSIVSQVGEWIGRGLSLIVGTKSNVKTNISGVDPRPLLTGQKPGAWSSDHTREVLAYRGWQFVAVRSKARIAVDSDLFIYQNDGRKNSTRKYAGSHGLVRKNNEGRPPVVPESDPLFRLLRRPNAAHSFAEFVFQYIQQISLNGKCLIWKVSNSLGIPCELWILPTALCTAVPPSDEFPEGGWKFRPSAQTGSVTGLWNSSLATVIQAGATIDARDVRSVQWPHPTHLGDGLSPVSAGSLWVDLANQMDEANWYQFRNGMTPSMIFSVDPGVNVSEDERTRFRDDLRNEASGTARTGTHLLLPPGVTATPRSGEETELEFSGSREPLRDMNLALHGMSPAAAGIGQPGSFAAYQSALIQTIEIGVQPELSLLSSELTAWLGTAFPGEPRVIEIEARSVADNALKQQEISTAVSAGNVLTVNEHRAAIGYPPLPGPAGQAFSGDKTQKISINGNAPTPTDGNTEATPDQNPPAVAATDIQDTALNGAQVASLLAVCDKLVAGDYPSEVTIAILTAAFPVMDPDVIRSIVVGLEEKKAADPEPFDPVPA